MATTTTTSLATTPATTSTRPVDSIPTKSNSPMDYNALRNANWNTIDKYYQKLLADYTGKYQQYTSGMSSNNKSEQDYARYLQSSVNDYKNQLINIYQEMLSVLSKNDDIIGEQKNITELLEKDNDKLIAAIAKLKDNKKMEATEAQSHLDNQQLLDDDLATLSSWNLYYKIGVCILAGCVVLMFIYRVWVASITPDYYITSSTIVPTNTNNNNIQNNKINNAKVNNTRKNTNTSTA